MKSNIESMREQYFMRDVDRNSYRGENNYVATFNEAFDTK